MAEPSADACLPDLDQLRADLFRNPWLHGLDDTAAEELLAHLPERRWASLSLGKTGRPLLQPRGGFPTFARQRELTLALAGAGADVVPLTIDSHTRHNEWERAASLLELSEAEGKDLLNGYPLVCHGALLTRHLYDGVDLPVSLRHGTPDARVLVEVALASGITDIEGGAICYTLPYARSFPLDRALLYWQYVDRLCARLSAPGRPVNRESFGPLTATLVPPALVVTVQVVELLLAAEQGVRSFSVSFGQTGSPIQDLALAKVLRAEAASALRLYGFTDCEVHLVYHQWMGAFPSDSRRAADLIATSALQALMVGADKVVVKTREEAVGIPSIEANADAVAGLRYIIRTTGGLSGLWCAEAESEAALITAEYRAIFERVVNTPGQSFWHSVYRSVLEGVIDIPFSPHEANRGELVPLRDATRAIRIVAPGAVPIPVECSTREADLLGDRARQTGLWREMIKDIALMVE